MDRAAARRLGFGGRVAHGAILLAEVSRIIGTELPGPGSLWMDSEFEFRAPVYVGDVVQVELVVEHVSSAVDIALVDIEARRQADGALVLAGKAKIRTLEEIPPMNYLPLDAQRLIVSGGTRGLGRAITEVLVDAGSSVIALYREDRDSAEALASALDVGGRLMTVQCDVGDSDDVARLFEEIDTLEPAGVHGFVHAASPPLADVPFGDLRWDTVQRFFETNVKGGLEIVQRCMPYFESAGSGRVVLIGLEAVQAPRKHWAHYVAAKSAYAGLARALALELAHIPATANVVAPGLLHTSDVLPDNVKALTRNATPLKRLASEEEVAEVVAFLIGKGGSFINGATIPLFGGRTFLA